MDCNWCAVCSNHFHSDHQASLYCSEECRKADALACCAFHDCDHPDGSANHDHLSFCHHHRPAIRIPSLPILNINPNPSAEQQQHGQQQQDEWTRFLQQQYNTQYHAHAAHTSMLPSLGHSVSGPFVSQSQQRSMPFPAQQQQQQSFLLSEALPTISCLQQQQHAKQLRQQKPAFRPHHQRQCSSLDFTPLCPMASGHGDDAGLALSMSSLLISRHNSHGVQTGHCDSSGECEQPCVVRKNKALPPPTLSHTLPPMISNPASLSPTSTSPPSTPLPSSSSSSSGEDNTGDETMSHAWPTMDKFFFPDHCCRTSACNPSSSRPRTAANLNAKAKAAKTKQSNQGNQGNSKKNFVSELPPPPAKHALGERDSANGGCIALSASIWGQGWHQVEPLPASFVKTIQKSNLLWSGCEKEHHSSARNHQRHRRDSGYGQGQGQGHGHGGCGHGNYGHGRAVNGSKNKMMRQWGQSKNASDASSWSTVCTSRLPRSLQFID